jgi:hypothetical protein
MRIGEGAMQLSLRRLLRSGSVLVAIVAIVALVAGVSARARPGLPVVQPNANTEPSGALRNGVLTVTLEAKPSLWHVNGPNRPPMTIEAFSEPGKSPLMPGPLVRANCAHTCNNHRQTRRGHVAVTPS